MSPAATTLRAGFAAARHHAAARPPQLAGRREGPDPRDLAAAAGRASSRSTTPATGARFVAAGFDLCGLLEETHRRIREAIGAAAGIDPELVVANSSHTHSAPYLSSALDRRFRTLGLVNSEPAYVDAVVDGRRPSERRGHRRAPARRRRSASATGASSASRPIAVRSSTASRSIAGAVPTTRASASCPRASPIPTRTLSPSTRSDGRPLGSVVVYACHPTAVGGSVHGWLSPDFVGPARDRVEAATGAPMVFLQGCGGNCGTGKWIAGTPQEDVVAMGGRLADGIESALAGATPVDLGPLRVGARRVDAPLDPAALGDVADLEAALAAVAAAPEPDISKAHEIGDRLAFVEQLAAGWKPRVVAARAGDLALVSLPGEQFVQHGLRIRDGSPIAETIVSRLRRQLAPVRAHRGGLPRGRVRGRWRLALRRAGRRRGDRGRGPGPAPDPRRLSNRLWGV